MRRETRSETSGPHTPPSLTVCMPDPFLEAGMVPRHMSVVRET